MTIPGAPSRAQVDVPPPSFAHILALTDPFGTFEHAELSQPRRSHGYCVDDVARVLIAIAREPEAPPAVAEVGLAALQFVIDAQGADGRSRNRRSWRGRWEGRRGVEDCWGRSVWALGTAAHRHQDPATRRTALAHFELGVTQRSPHRRAMAFAALGAAEVLTAQPGHPTARQLLADTVTAIGPVGAQASWPWPEPRLSYANAALPESLLAAGHLLDRPAVVADGLTLLGWLLGRETVQGHLSPTPVGGAGRRHRPPTFDQQPIEVAAMADACARAEAVTGDEQWRRGVEMAVGWFAGINDVGAVMWDAETGGGYDGLHARGPNLNQGAESTLALITTLQHAHQVASVAR